jgi:hypothetical protein
MSRFINPVPQFFLNDGSIASSGKLEFFENGDYSTQKNTYNDSLMTIANTNPVSLDGQGRMPSCFGSGLYSVKFYSYDNTQPGGKGALQWTRDDVDLSGGGGGAFIDWSAVVPYPIGSLVKDGDNYYILYGSTTSLGERPSTTPTEWEQVAFLTVFNDNKTYSEDEVIIYNGFLYRSLEDDNEDTPPSAKWANLTFNDSISGNLAVSGTITAGTYSGGGVLTQTVPGGTLVAVRTTEKAIGSSTTLADDGVLQISLKANTFYQIKVFLYWNGNGSVTNGIKCAFTGATQYGLIWIANTNTSTANIAPTSNDESIFTKLPNSGGATEIITAELLVQVGGSDSDFKLQWAQAASEATTTRLTRGSMIATRLN